MIPADWIDESKNYEHIYEELELHVQIIPVARVVGVRILRRKRFKLSMVSDLNEISLNTIIHLVKYYNYRGNHPQLEAWFKLERALL